VHGGPDGAPAVVRHPVLADPTGRRRRRLAVVGRVATAALGLWLVLLILGGLGLQPLAGLPVVRDLGAADAAPPALPRRVQTAVDRGATVTPAARKVRPVRVPSPVRVRPQAGTTPAPAPGDGRTTTPHRPAPPAPNQTTSPSLTAPGQARPAPGQTKTTTGPPTTTPGTAPGSRGNNGKALGAKGTVTSP
jgi:hypothetical protein